MSDDSKRMTENQKKMLFCIEGLRNRDKKYIEQNPDATPLAEYLLKHFFDDLHEDWQVLYNACKDRTGVVI